MAFEATVQLQIRLQEWRSASARGRFCVAMERREGKCNSGNSNDRQLERWAIYITSNSPPFYYPSTPSPPSPFSLCCFLFSSAHLRSAMLSLQLQSLRLPSLELLLLRWPCAPRLGLLFSRTAETLQML